MLFAILWLVFFTVYALILFILLPVDAGENRIRRRLQELAGKAKPPPRDDEEGYDRRPLKEVIAQGLDRYLVRQSYARRVQARLRKADWRLHVSEFVALQAAGSIGGIALSLSLFGGRLAWLLALIGFWLPHLALGMREKERSRALGGQLPDALGMIANSLRSGYSFLQALDVVAKEMPDPMARELAQVLKENRVGISLDDALSRLSERAQNEDLDLVVTAVLVQRQVGGNLAEVLAAIEHTIRERVRLLGEIRTLSAQGRLSGWILSLLPLVLGLAIYAINTPYMQTLLDHPLGWGMLGVSGAMQVIGILLIRRLVHVEM